MIQVVAALDRDNAAVANAGRYVSGADTADNVLASRWVRSSDRSADFDSTSLTLTSRRTGYTQAIAQLRGEKRRFTLSLDAARMTRTERIVAHPLAEREEAVLFPDGWIAVARVAPFRVDWRRPNGSWIRGAPIPYAVVTMGDEEKRFVMQQIALKEGRQPSDPATLADWPPEFPAFERNGLVTLSDGRLLLGRPRTPGVKGTVHLIVSRDAMTVRELVTPDNVEIIGSGKRGLFARFTKPDGLQRLRLMAPMP